MFKSQGGIREWLSDATDQYSFCKWPVQLYIQNESSFQILVSSTPCIFPGSHVPEVYLERKTLERAAQTQTWQHVDSCKAKRDFATKNTKEPQTPGASPCSTKAVDISTEITLKSKLLGFFCSVFLLVFWWLDMDRHGNPLWGLKSQQFCQGSKCHSNNNLKGIDPQSVIECCFLLACLRWNDDPCSYC